MQLARSFVVLLVTAFPALAQTPEAASPSVRESLSGTWVHAGGDADRKALDAALDFSVEGYFFMARGSARGQVAARNEIRRSLTVSLEAERVAVQFADSPRVEAPLDGSSTPATINGESMRVVCALRGSALVQRFEASEGLRRNEFIAGADGRTLLLRVTVESPKLTHPLRYELHYRRAG
jgi:hypothetical protein